MLSDSQIQHKVVVISACYSGIFIDPIKDESSMVITSAAKDKTSFGCSDDETMTYFGRAFFNDSLTKDKTFKQAFDEAKVLIKQRESDEDYNHSHPQFSSGKAIEKQLLGWRKYLNNES